LGELFVAKTTKETKYANATCIYHLMFFASVPSILITQNFLQNSAH